jgi:hypothetical protein
MTDYVRQCPGGSGCFCCGDGCDCGCRNDCPKWRAANEKARKATPDWVKGKLNDPTSVNTTDVQEGGGS